MQTTLRATVKADAVELEAWGRNGVPRFAMPRRCDAADAVRLMGEFHAWAVSILESRLQDIKEGSGE